MRLVKRSSTPFALLSALLVLCGCATQTAVRPVLNGAQIESGITFEEEQRLQDLCLFGVPLRDDETAGDTLMIVREGYALELSVDDKIPLWVCEHVRKNHIRGDAERKNNFKADPDLDPGVGAELPDYKGSGFDRGHQAPAADFKYSQKRTDESFYLSNMCPQVGEGFNRDIWRVLEDRARDIVEDGGDAYIITGPIFYDPKEENSETADGWISYKVIGKNRVAVPTHFYKIVVAKDDAGQWRAIAFVLDNKRYPKQADRAYDFQRYIESIDLIEVRTGLNFMPDLDVDEPELEVVLEKEESAVWPEFASQ
ncbi:MAG: DNA/RNA non-specific endonuclease [Candidatus Hydrogenedentes bacterium]|nr:DNA/RNA non-specific endonuclease [Candidatus Hydrogenedentota bacterium]